MAFRLHSRLVALNIGAIAVATVIVGYFFFGGSLRSAFESEIQQQLYRSATLAKSYVRVQTDTSDPVDLAGNISKLLDVRVTIIAPDGKVLGDSDVSRENLSGVANHSDRRKSSMLFGRAADRQSGRVPPSAYPLYMSPPGWMTAASSVLPCRCPTSKHSSAVCGSASFWSP